MDGRRGVSVYLQWQDAFENLHREPISEEGWTALKHVEARDIVCVLYNIPGLFFLVSFFYFVLFQQIFQVLITKSIVFFYYTPMKQRMEPNEKGVNSDTSSERQIIM